MLPGQSKPVDPEALDGLPPAPAYFAHDARLNRGRRPLLEDLLSRAIPPAHGFGAHTAPLGIRFLRHQQDPALARSALVALHGSWNRSAPSGYHVVLLRWDDEEHVSESVFLSGFEEGGDIIGRPVDIAEAGDGSLFVSDDYAGAIYRLTQGGVVSPVAVAEGTCPAVAQPLDTGLVGALSRVSANWMLSVCCAPGSVLAADKSGLTVACGEGALCLTQLQRAGGKRLAAADFLRGFPLAPGQCFGAPA